MNGTEPGALELADTDTRKDLALLLTRARRVDPDGDARLSGHGLVLAVYVCPLHGAGLPTVLGLRTIALAQPWTGDVVTPLGGLADRLARDTGSPTLPLPPVRSTAVGWAAASPPRSGWQQVGEVSAGEVAARAAAGAEEISAGLPDRPGAPALAKLRAGVWSRPSPWSTRWSAPVPDGACFAADALGVLGRALDQWSPVAVHASGSWLRLTTRLGYVLVR